MRQGDRSRFHRLVRGDRVISSGISLRGPTGQGRILIPTLRDEALEQFAFVIDGAPEIMFHAVDLHEDLVEVPSPMPEGPHRLDPAAPDLGRENRPEPVPGSTGTAPSHA